MTNEQLLEDLKQFVDAKIDGVEQRLTTRMDGMDRRFDAVDKRFDKVDQRFDEVDERLDEIQNAIGTELQRVDEHDKQLKRLTQKLA